MSAFPVQSLLRLFVALHVHLPAGTSDLADMRVGITHIALSIP
jgi:hypothetical protein